MATAAENLNIIASVKSEIKGIIATDSNHLEAYPNKIAECIVDAPSVHSWADTRTTADGGTIKDGIAYVKALRGKSIKFNQLAQLEGASSRIGVKTTSQGNKIILNGTSTSEGYVAFMFRAANFQSTHKYLIRYKSEDSSKAFVSINTNPSYANKIWEGVDGGNYVVTVYSGITFTNFVLYADLIDLTEIYGSGNEPTTLLQFAQDMGYSSIDDVPYYEKTDGTIVLNCKQKSVKSYGRKVVQLVDSSKIPATTTSNGITFTNNGDGTMSVVGTATANAFISTWIPVVNGHKYLFASLTQNGSGTTFYAYLTGNVNGANEYARGIIYTANGTGNTYPVWCYVKSGASVNTKIIPVLLDLTEMGIDSLTTADAVAQYMGYADAASMPYIPYNDGTNIPTDTLTLPTLTAFPNGLCGVGTAYDEVDLATGKATKRFACKVLNGSENWSLESVNASGIANFLIYFSDMKQADVESILMICDLPRQSTRIASTTDEGYLPQPNTACYFRILSSKASSVSAFKTYLASHPITMVYELATAEESTFTPQRAYYKASNNGQEVASADTATAPFTAEIGYKEATASELLNALNA